MAFVRAREGLKIRDPERRDFLPDGLFRGVPFTQYWADRARDGDVALRQAPPPDEEIEGYVAPQPAALHGEDDDR